MDALRKVEAVQDITLMLHEQARLAGLNRPDEQVLCFHRRRCRRLLR